MITIEQLKKLGFKQTYERVFEPEFSYEDWSKDVNDSYVSLCFEYDAKGNFAKQILNMNDRELTGRPPTIEDLKMLIELM